MSKLRIIGAALCGLATIGIDFTSTLMSVVGDLFFVGGIAILLWPLVKDVFAEEDD